MGHPPVSERQAGYPSSASIVSWLFSASSGQARRLHSEGRSTCAVPLSSSARIRCLSRSTSSQRLPDGQEGRLCVASIRMYGGYLSACRLRSLPRRASSPAPSSAPSASETRHEDKDIPTRAAQKTATTTTTDTIASSAAISRNAFLLSVLFIYPPDAQNRPVWAFLAFSD